MTVDIAVAPTAPLEPTTPIKPSEAIRLGCLTTRQIQLDMFALGGACALGALVLGLGLGPEDATFATMERIEVMLAGSGSLACPVCQERYDGTSTIVHLNDAEGWSREAIADWLESRGL